MQNKIANIPASTSISDNPSDSRLVTEKTIYDYVASGNDGKTRTLDAVDLNTITNTGFYSCNVCTNRPTENNGVMLVLKNGFSSDNLVQVYWTFVADVMWVRHKDLGTWKAWKKVANIDDLAGKQDTLTAGENISIVNNTISATGGGDKLKVLGSVSQYTAEHPLDLNTLDVGVYLIWVDAYGLNVSATYGGSTKTTMFNLNNNKVNNDHFINLYVLKKVEDAIPTANELILNFNKLNDLLLCAISFLIS